MEQHSRTVEYCSLHHLKASPPDQLVERPKKGAVEDDLSLFHRDTYIRKYRISQGYAARYPDEKLSDEDELEGDGWADLVGPLAKMSLKDSERDTEGPTLERATKKGRARKTDPPEPSGRGRKKTVKQKKGQEGSCQCQRQQGQEYHPKC